MSFMGRLRCWSAPLANTPFHPQWFTLRGDVAKWRWVGSRANGRVLDVGCADGRARRELPGCNVIGLDYPGTVGVMYQSRPDVFADGAHLPFQDHMFDTVLLLDVLEHVADARSMLNESARVLKRGGRLLVGMPFLYPVHDAPHDYRRYTTQGLELALRRAGLELDQPPRAIGGAFETAALLSAVACASAVHEALRTRHWRLLFAPLLVLAIPIVNALGWVLERVFGDSSMMAHGYFVEARSADAAT